MSSVGRLSSLALAAVMSASLLGCQSEVPRIEPPSEAVADMIYSAVHAQRPLGPIGIKLKALLEHGRAERCESVQADLRRELVNRLDQDTARIQAMAAVAEPGFGVDRVKWGPTTVLRINEPINPHAGWVDAPSSWQSAYDTYLTIKDRPSHSNWVWLDGVVRSLILNDTLRIVHTANFYLDKDSGLMISTLDRAMSACLRDPDCVSPALSSAQIEYIQKIPYYSAYWTLFERTGSVGEKRKQLIELGRWFASDVRRFRLHLNPTISRPSRNELRLPLIAGPFAGHEAEFSSYVESVWSSRELKLKIAWTEATVVPLAFRVLLGDTIGERAIVNFEKRTLQLFADSRLRTVAHEIGHVLGFLDHYYTVWHPETCTYVQQSNAGDIMSFEGVVTPGEWQELDQAYPYQIP